MQSLYADALLCVIRFLDNTSSFCLKITNHYHYNHINISSTNLIFHDAGFNEYLQIIEEFNMYNPSTIIGIIHQSTPNLELLKLYISNFELFRKNEVIHIVKHSLMSCNKDILTLVIQIYNINGYIENVLSEIDLTLQIIRFIDECVVTLAEIRSEICCNIIRQANYPLINFIGQPDNEYDDLYIDESELLQCGSLDVIKYIHDNELEIVETGDYPAEIYAMTNSDINVYKYILEKDEITDSHLDEPPMIGNITVAKILIGGGVEISASTLERTLYNKQYKVFKYLHKKGYQLKGKRMMHILISLNEPLSDIIELCKYTQKRPTNSTCLNCIKFRNIEVLEWCIKNYDDLWFYDKVMRVLVGCQVLNSLNDKFLKCLLHILPVKVQINKKQYLRLYILCNNLDFIYDYIDEIKIKTTFDLLPIMDCNVSNREWLYSKSNDWTDEQKQIVKTRSAIKYSLRHMDIKTLKVICSIRQLYNIPNKKISIVDTILKSIAK